MKKPPVELDGPAVRVVGNLHRGALNEIKIDRLLNKQRQPRPQHEKGLSSSLSDISRVPARAVQSEPRTNRPRSASGGEQISPKNLFAEHSDLFSYEERLYLDHSSEAFPLHSELRQRRNKQSAVPLNKTLSQREILLKNIRQQPRGGRLSSSTRKTHVSPRHRPRSRWVIPIDSTFKVTWDIMTVILSIANSHAMHVSIRERKFGFNAFMLFCNVWFMLDILLNFVTERKTPNGEILRDYRSICARYLTSWFAVDAIALIPWETLYVKPIIDLQNRRGFLQKYFFRSRAVVRVTRHLRGRHFRWFGTVAKRTKQHGVGASRLLRLIIKYAPKYVLFLRNMKGGVAVRVLRQIQWFRRFYHNIVQAADGDKPADSVTGSLTMEDIEDEDDLSSKSGRGANGNNNNKKQVQLVYENWESMEEDTERVEDDDEDDDDDDGIPF
eukprot:CAMPEP_0176016692 /NCGR_PEP_ID=MMETSP0120_2-20121206/7982_1 /TAXON_ID=160619 /ORGANISM="Kryptoperidinium foliaceum, Strain CCMP 1326" /LENGTH=440 /DNA_ID=CAMNT_0017349697 /DNA_START=82 /DNA_END=1403 /DNA_ORIENTATION=+